jgi:hypothetical protein
MKDVKDISICLVDHGIFFGLAQQLAKSVKRVDYYSPGWERGFSSCRDGSIGDGFEEVGLIHDLWEHKKDYDLFAFPDIQHSGIQLELESQGFPVWGSRTGDSLETLRLKFMRTVDSLGLEVASYRTFYGLSDLRDFLKKNNDKYIKISRWRADMETYHHINYELSRNWLDEKAVVFGDLQDEIMFMVFDPIDTDLEVGYDGYSIDGWFPNMAIHGIEKKDQGYIGAAQHYDDLPEQVREVNNRFSEVLAGHRYRNFWSTEIRIVGNKFYFIDPTCRAGMPSGDGQFVLYKNLAEIMWRGAHGEVVEPEFSAKYVVQSLIEHNGDPDHWRTVQIEDGHYDHVRLLSPCKIRDNTYAISPSSAAGETVGSVLTWGDDLEAAIKENQKLSKEISKSNPVTINTDAVVDVLKEMHSAAEQGVHLTDEKLPDVLTLVET